MRTITWGPIVYTRKLFKKGDKSDKNKKHKKKTSDKRHKKETSDKKRHEEVTLSGREVSWTSETVEVLAEGEVRKTWVTNITVTTEEVAKQVEGAIKKNKPKKSKGSKEDSGSDESSDSDKSDSDEEDPIQRLARLLKFHGSVVGRAPRTKHVTRTVHLHPLLK